MTTDELADMGFYDDLPEEEPDVYEETNEGLQAPLRAPRREQMVMATAIEIAQQLNTVREKIKALRAQEAELEESLAAEMPEKLLQVPGVGVFERNKKDDRKAWDHEGVFSSLLAKIRAGEVKRATLEITEDGEMVEEDDVALTYRVLSSCARPEWRVTDLRAYGIQPDEFCVKTPAGYSVKLVTK